MEDPPSFWFVVIPEEVYDLGRPLSKVPTREKIQGAVRMTKSEALKLDDEPTLFGLDEAEADVYKYATHFRRQLKARLLAPKIVTQIVRETTLAPDDFLKSNGQRKRRLEDDATVAWKLSTGAYYKAGGRTLALCPNHVRSLGSTADMWRQHRGVRLVPMADIAVQLFR